MTDDKEAVYEQRNRNLQRTIDAIAELPEGEIEEHGRKSELAEERGLETHRIQYVLDKWPELVKWRRHQMTGPVSVNAAEAVDDERLKQLADGAGDFTVTIDLSLVNVYRAMNALPSDLSTEVYVQTLQQADQFPRDEIRRVIESQD